MKQANTGRLTLPTDVDMVAATIRLKDLLGADALRDCDGTDMPEELLTQDAKIYATYYTTRKDNDWAMQHPEEIQQEYLISDRVTARGDRLRIELMKGFHTEQLKVNTIDPPGKWWEVIDRTTGEIVSPDHWHYEESSGEVVIDSIPYHPYTVSFLAFLIRYICTTLSPTTGKTLRISLPTMCASLRHKSMSKRNSKNGVRQIPRWMWCASPLSSISLR